MRPGGVGCASLLECFNAKKGNDADTGKGNDTAKVLFEQLATGRYDVAALLQEPLINTLISQALHFSALCTGKNSLVK
jgi:hypothetical protein